MRILVLLLTIGGLVGGCEKLDNLSASQKGADDLAERVASRVDRPHDLELLQDRPGRLLVAGGRAGLWHRRRLGSLATLLTGLGASSA